MPKAYYRHCNDERNVTKNKRIGEFLPGTDGQLQVVRVRILVYLRVEREQRPSAGDVHVVSVRHFDDGESGAGGSDVHGASTFRELNKKQKKRRQIRY